MTDWQSAIKFLGGSEEKENALIAEMAKEVREIVESLRDSNGGVRGRAQHARASAGIKNAEFRVLPGIPEDLRVGFLKPDASYRAVLRFSNASGLINRADSEKDLRGVAIKLNPPEGDEHDFLMTNAEEHHARDAFEAMATSVAFSTDGALRQLIDADDARIQKLVQTLDGFRELARRVGKIDATLIILRLSRQMKTPVESLATETYWSRAPLRIGGVVVKYLLRPATQKVTPEESEKNLGDELKRRLERGEVRFNFEVQRYVDEDDTPLEDARKRWKSRPERIAELVIPRQTLADDKVFFESLEFTPWHVNTGDFQPIGSMNRARRLVYPSAVSARKQGSA